MKGVINYLNSINGDNQLNNCGYTFSKEHFQNRYAITKTKKGSQELTTYFFSTPIIRTNDNEIVDLCFEEKKNYYSFRGSDSDISINEKGITFSNIRGYLRMDLDLENSFLQKNHIISGLLSISPNLNGVTIVQKIQHNNNVEVDFDWMSCDFGIKANSKALSFLHDSFSPFATISSIGCTNEEGKVLCPAKLEYERTGSNRVKIKLSPPTGIIVDSIVFEVCLRERKLFMDTTVCSRFPIENNAFGAVSYIGKTLYFGVEWLYSKIDFGVLNKCMINRIRKIQMIIPRLSNSLTDLYAESVKLRFCSLGSTWMDKQDGEGRIIKIIESGGFYCLDLSSQLINCYDEVLKPFAGIIIKSKGYSEGSTVISTGDCCSYPQVLKIIHE